MWLTEAGNAVPIALVDGDRDEMSVPVGPGDYLLWVARDGEPTSMLEHYVIKHGREPEPAILEEDDLANDTLAGAQSLPANVQFVTWLGDGDVDYWSVESMTRVGCCSWRDGSGILDLRIEIRDADDNRLDGSFFPETIDGEATLFGADLPDTYYLRLTKRGQDPEVTGEFVRCWVTND
jgi:hypothetical protein